MRRNHLKDFSHFVAVAYDIRYVVFILKLIFQPDVLFTESLFFQADRFQIDNMSGYHGCNHGQQFFAVI
jgi:hypothetical protein